MHEATGHTCVGCGEPILHGQSVVRVDAGLLLATPEAAHFEVAACPESCGAASAPAVNAPM